MSRRMMRTFVFAVTLVASFCIGSEASAQFRHQIGNTAPSGDDLGSEQAILLDLTGGIDEAGLISIGSNTCIIYNPGDFGLLQISDEDFDDGDDEFFRFENFAMRFSSRIADTTARQIVNENDTHLNIQTDGEFMSFFSDVDNDTSQVDCFRWFNNSVGLADRIMQLGTGGQLYIDGTLSENVAFDVAEAFLKLEAVEPGQLIAVDSSRHDAVRLTNGAADRAVIGVASTHPGVLLGGGAFDVERIEQNWGKEHAERFRKEQAGLETRVLEAHEHLREQQARLESIETFSLGVFSVRVDEAMVVDVQPTPTQERPFTVKRSDWEQLQAGYAAAKVQFAQEVEAAAIDLFLKETLVPVALAGRVPVQVDGSYGHIMAGDYLAPSPIPGVAMKAKLAGPTVGVAL
ncbi:MAG: hypothetical protein R3B90_23740, partial [Planctomycetaceae bacterium]